MKRTLLFLLFILLSISSFGQKIRFSDSTNVWHGYDWSDAVSPPLSFPYFDSYIGDTIIHAITYKILKQDMGASMVYVREDTLTNKVYAIKTLPPDNDSTEQLLYDYSLNIGDTFETNHIRYQTTAKDSVIINALSYHTWHMHPFYVDSIDMSVGSLNDIDIVEGIGCMNDPCFPLRPFSFETITNLTCFNNRGTTPPLSHTVGPYFNNSTSCSLTFGLVVNNVANKNKNASLFPNPINESSEIVIPYNITSGNLVIVNDLGQEIINMPFQNKEQLLIGDQIKVPGIYCYRVRDNQSGATFSGKFVY